MKGIMPFQLAILYNHFEIAPILVPQSYLAEHPSFSFKHINPQVKDLPFDMTYYKKSLKDNNQSIQSLLQSQNQNDLEVDNESNMKDNDWDQDITISPNKKIDES